MLANLGDCPLEQGFDIGTLKDLTIDDVISGGAGEPTIYDMSGRRMRGPVEELATGIYILKWDNLTKKVFVQ